MLYKMYLYPLAVAPYYRYLPPAEGAGCLGKSLLLVRTGGSGPSRVRAVPHACIDRPVAPEHRLRVRNLVATPP